jgi:hypothetical protein
MDFFGHMEGALRSGKRAAEELVRQSRGLRQEGTPASPSPVTRIAGAAPIRERTAFRHEIHISFVKKGGKGTTHIATTPLP